MPTYNETVELCKNWVEARNEAWRARHFAGYSESDAVRLEGEADAIQVLLFDAITHDVGEFDAH